MDTTLVTAMSGVLGSLVGGSASVATTWVTQRTLTRRDLIREELRKREKLYGEFIGECAKLFVDACTHSLEKPEKLFPSTRWSTASGFPHRTRFSRRRNIC